MMKKMLVSIIVAVTLSALMLSVAGCSLHQQGETAAEGHRRHLRVSRIAREQLAEDVDAVMMYEQPLKLSEIRSK